MLFRRKPSFFARKIEAHYAAGAEIEGQLRHLQRYVKIAHGTNNQSRSHAKILAAAL